jgi:hypothetical protein
MAPDITAGTISKVALSHHRPPRQVFEISMTACSHLVPIGEVNPEGWCSIDELFPELALLQKALT